MGGIRVQARRRDRRSLPRTRNSFLPKLLAVSGWRKSTQKNSSIWPITTSWTGRVQTSYVLGIARSVRNFVKIAERQIAMACDRPDDARLWSYLKLLIMEFSSSSDGFNEAIFSSELQSTVRLASPPTLSPRASFSKSPQAIGPELLSPPTKPSTSSRPRSPLPPAALPVITSPLALRPSTVQSPDRRQGDTSADSVEHLLDSASTSRSSSISTNRVRTFPLDPPSARKSAETVSGARPGVSTGKRSTLLTKAMSNSQSSGMARKESFSDDDEYPDPYGVTVPPVKSPPMTQGSGSSSSSRSMQSSPRVTTQPDVKSTGANLRSGSKQSSGEGKSVAMARGAPKGRQDSQDAAALAAYRKRREGVLKDWWNTYVATVSRCV